MKLFLEGIYYSLYNKIEAQNKIVNNIIEELNLKEINNVKVLNIGYT